MNENFFANRITELRIERNVSEQKMSYELGKSKTYIWSIASKKAYPSMELFFEICEYLNVTPAEFFEPLAKDENLEMIKMPVLYSGTVTNTPENGLSDADVVQGFALQLDKLAVKKGELVVVLPVDEKNTFAAETEYPIGNSKDVGAMIRNNLTSLISEDVDQYTHSWRLIESNSSGQGRFQVAATKTAPIEALYDIAEKKGLNLTRVEIAPNVLERAGMLLRRDKKYGINVQGDAVAVIDV